MQQNRPTDSKVWVIANFQDKRPKYNKPYYALFVVLNNFEIYKHMEKDVFQT